MEFCIWLLCGQRAAEYFTLELFGTFYQRIRLLGESKSKLDVLGNQVEPLILKGEDHPFCDFLCGYGFDHCLRCFVTGDEEQLIEATRQCAWITTKENLGRDFDV